MNTTRRNKQSALRLNITSIAVLLTAVVLVTLVLRWVSIFTESINWDEFALLHRVERTLREGQLFGGGRPGLVTLLLVPIVRGCTDAIAAAVHARILWQVFTIAYLAGVFVLIRNWFRFSGRPERGALEGAIAVALLAFLPAFVAWSVQVRTDQAALAAATWGGVFLLSERRTHAIVAGALFGVAVLCTQKGIYVAGLTGALWVSAIVARLRALTHDSRGPERVRQATQLVLVAVSAMGAVVAYLLLAPTDAGFVSERVVSNAWDDMRRTREIVGYRAYATAAKQSLLHGFLIIGLIVASVRGMVRRRWLDGHLLATCWAILLLGCLVAVVHGSGWAYFIMTLGLFAAVPLGLASGHLAQSLGQGRPLVIGLLLFGLILGSVPTTVEMLQGNQADQRETTRWIRDSGLSAYRGYQVDGALVCMADPEPIRPMSHRLNMGPLSPDETSAFVDEFRTKQVAYVLDMDRLGYFPPEVLEFWSTHYRWYYGPVWVTGFGVSDLQQPQTLDVIVPGHYRWRPMPPHRDAELLVGDVPVAPGAETWLEIGQHAVATRPASAHGSLTLGLTPPAAQRIYYFMDRRQGERLGGAR